MIIQHRTPSAALLLVIGSILPLVMMVGGCSSSIEKIDTSSIPRPKHILGNAINSSRDEFAAGLEPQRAASNGGDSLLFTSNARGREVIYGARLSKDVDQDSIRPSEVRVHSMPQAFVRNTGTVTRGSRSMIYATSAAVDTAVGAAISRQRGIVGGTDLYEELRGQQAHNIIELNSSAWDAHPSIGSNDDAGIEVIVFSSDRMDTTGGFSAPYERSEHKLSNGTTRQGNADIYIAFRSKDSTRWSHPINFGMIQTVDSVNTFANEYSPYLYCVSGTPHLLFASNRSGNYDIYDAALRIEWSQRTPERPWVPNVRVESVKAFPMSSDSINTSYDELFPYVKEPLIYFSSNRFGVKSPEFAKATGYGGLDIYATEAEVICLDAPKEEKNIVMETIKEDSIAMPSIIPVKIDTVYGNVSYDVVVLNTKTGTPETQDLTLRVTVNGESAYSGPNSSFAYAQSMKNLPNGLRISAEAGSSYQRTPCNEKDIVLTHYSHVALHKRSATARIASLKTYRDSIIQDKPIPVKRTKRLYDTLAKGQIFQGTLRSSLREAIDLTQDGRMRISRDTVVLVDSIPNPRIQRFTNTVRKVDSIFTFDTSLVACSYSAGRSISSMFGDLVIPQQFRTTYDGKVVPRNEIDVVIHDTIYLVPQYQSAPICDTTFGPPINSEVRNVPYFQTAFWEVNTTRGYRSHLARLRNGDLEDAPFIELNWRNSYWGDRTGKDVSTRLMRRREDYQAKARIIDASIDHMTRSTSNMLREFWTRDANNPESKLIISMRAYSDIRPVNVGRYISDTAVRYVATSFDENELRFTRATPVHVRPGASLVGENNDTLSKLRAYYGFQAVYNELSQDSLLSALRSRGLVLLPSDAATAEEYEAKMRTARVIVLAEGRYVDTSVIPAIKAYSNGASNYYDLDGVRRVDVHVRRINLRNDAWVLPECCR